jgi:flagellin
MALSITTNVPSLFTQNALNNTTSALDTSLQRLSTGLKINSGADGPAAYVISQQQQAQIAGLQTAIQNTSKATDLVQTADGALGTISNLLTQIRGLALDSANSGVQDPTALAANQSQIQNAIQTIDNIANNTQFGSKQILNGSAGFNATSTDTTSFTGLGATATTTPGVYTVNSDGSTDTAAQLIAAGNVGATGPAKGEVYLTQGNTAATVASVAVDATVNGSLATGTNLSGAETLTITGSNGTAVQVALTSGETIASVESAINAHTSTTGVTASTGTVGHGHGLVLTSANGQNFTVVSNVDGTTAGSTGIGTTAFTSSTASNGGQGSDLDAVAGVAGNEFLTAAGHVTSLAANETLTIAGQNGTAAITLDGGSTLAQVIDTINNYTAQTGVTASQNSTTGGLQLEAANFGGNFTVVSNVGADSGTTGIGTTTVSSSTAAAGAAGGAPTVVTGLSLGEQNAQKGALSVLVGTSGANTAFVSNSTNLALATTLTITGPSGLATINLAQGSTNTQVAAAINNYTSQTGVVADTDATGGGLRLYTQQFGKNFQVSESNSNAAYGNGSLGIGSTNVNTGNGNNTVANAFNANFVVTTGQNAVVKLTNSAGTAQLVTGDGATVTSTTGAENGLTFTLTPSSSNPFVTTGVTSSNITAANGTLTFQIGANAGQTASLAINNVSASNIGVVSGNQFANLAAIDVTTTAGAQAAIAVVDQAINDVSTEAGTLGAFQTNTLQSTATNLQTTLTNTQSAESTIADTDYSSEIANFTALQVQEQAGVSVLGLANQIPQNVLTLLQKL